METIVQPAFVPPQDVVDTIDMVKHVLPFEALPEQGALQDVAAAKSALDKAWNAVRRELGGEPLYTNAGPERLICLLSRIRDDKNLLHSIEVQQRYKSMLLVTEALRRFREIKTVDQLMDMCPRVMSTLGFDRTMMSTVRNGLWTPRAAYFGDDAELAQRMVQSGQEKPQRLSPQVPEYRLLLHDRCILVPDAIQNEAVYQSLAESDEPHGYGYVAAGVVRNGHVVGLLHGAYHVGERIVDEFDLDVIDLFADGFGYILECTLLANRAASIHAEVEELTRNIAAAVEGFGRGDEYVTEDPWPDKSVIVQSDVGAELTRRETEVLQLMASGNSNKKIAELLVIAPATAKSHVKHVLRKLGVENRVEAVSLWYNKHLPDRSVW